MNSFVKLSDFKLLNSDNFTINDIRFNLLSSPDILNISVIPEEFRDSINQQLDSCIAKGFDLAAIKKYFNTNQTKDHWPHFLIYNLMLDNLRKENFFDILPIKKELIDRWIKL